MKKTIYIYLFAAFFVYNCNNNPVTSDDKQSPNSYVLYVGNWGGSEVFVVDTDSNAVVDTIRGFTNVIWDLALTRSGAKLYVCTREGPVNSPGNIYSVNLNTKEVCLIESKSGNVFVAPNGTVLIFSKEPYQLPQKIGIIDTLTNTVSFFDTLDLKDEGYNDQSVVFDRTKPLLYAVNNNKQLFAYDYHRKEVVRIYDNLYDPYRMVISPDGRTLYVAGGPVFDLENDSPITGPLGWNILGSLALSPDGEYLYITDPGGYVIDPNPSGEVLVFQTSTNSYIDTIDVNQASGEAWTLTDRIVVTPDGQTAYVSNWLHNLFVIDLELREVKGIIYFDGFTVPIALGIKQ